MSVLASSEVARFRLVDRGLEGRHIDLDSFPGTEADDPIAELDLRRLRSPPERRTRPEVRRRLGMLASRMRGPDAVELRRRPVPHAYRVFFRQIGLDPDDQRTPVEEAALARLVHGGFESHGALADALLLAVVETGVPVWAVDDATLTLMLEEAQNQKPSGWGRPQGHASSGGGHRSA